MSLPANGELEAYASFAVFVFMAWGDMARLLIAERENPPRFPLEKGEPEGISLQEHIAKAAKLIEETDYNRRLPELQELQHKISAIAANDTGSNV